MRSFSSLPIRVHMCLLVLLLALPAIGVIVHSSSRLREESVIASGNEVEKLAHTVAAEIQLLVDNTRQLSLTLSRLPEMHSRDAAALNPLLKELLNHYPYYTTIFATDEHGMVWASSRPTPRRHSLADRRYIKDALATGRFSAGEYAIGRVSGLPTMSFGYPIKDKKGATTGVIGFALDLSATEHLLVRAKYNTTASYSIFDHKGTFLFRSTQAGEFVGQDDRPDLFKRMLDGPDGGVFVASTNDNVRRLVAYRKLRLGNDQRPYMYIRAGIPASIATEAGNRALLRDLMLFAPFLLSALAMGWLIGKRCVVDRVHALQAAGRCLAAGDLNTRVAGRVSGGELGELAQTFDSMASSLQAREEEVREKGELLHAVIEGTTDAIFVKDMQGRYLLFNSGAAAMTGMSPAEIIGKDDTFLFPAVVAEVLMEKDRALREGEVMGVCEETFADRAGMPHIVLVTKGAIKDRQGTVTGTFGIARDITRRKQAEQERERLIQELENERLRFESVLRQIPVGVVISEASVGHVTYSNEEAAHIFGDALPPGGATIDYSRWKLFLPDGSPLKWEQNPLNRALRGGEVIFGEEHLIERCDGTTGFVRCNAAPIRDIGGCIVGSVAAFFDITAQVQVDEALRASEQHLRRVLDSLGAFVGVLKLDGTVVGANRVALEAAGVDAADVINRRFAETYWWSWSPQVQQQLYEAIYKAATGETSRYDVLLRLRDGELHPFDFMLAPLRDARGNITHLIPSAIDITGRKQAENSLQKAHDELEHRVQDRTAELAAAIQSLKREVADRKKAEQALADKEKILRTLVNTNPESLLLLDVEGTVVVLNETCARRMNKSVPEVMGKNVFSLLPREIGAMRKRYFQEAITGGQPVRFEDMRQGRYYDHYIHPISDENGDVRQLAILGIDTTDHKRTQEALKQETARRLRVLEQLRENERSMIQQSRQAAMGEMISNIAHQWRQPLNTLGMLIQRVQLFYDMGEFSKEFLDATTRESMRLIRHMSGTIEDFRNFFRPDKEMVTFSADEAIRQTISLVEASFKHQQIDLRVHSEGESLITGYPNEYSQVLLNILLNARDAFAERNIQDACITLRTCTQGDRVVVAIADNAGGIPVDIMDNIFDPHFTTKGPQGSGIGLFMAKNIIERSMNGRLTVCNTGDGAEFRIEV